MTYTGGTPHKTHVIITILALIILAGVLGFFAYQQNPQLFSWLSQPSQKEAVDTATWQTYRNEEYGFEFEYPNDWTLYDDQENNRLSVENEEGMLIIESGITLAHGLALDSICESIEIVLGDKKVISTNGKCTTDSNSPFYNLQNIGDGRPQYDIHYFNELLGREFEFRFSGDAQGAVPILVKQILATFKFTK